MDMDRRFVGILAIIGILSASMGTVIFSRGVPSSYSVLFYEYPKVRGRGVFSSDRELEHITLGLVMNAEAGLVKFRHFHLRELEDIPPPEESEEEPTLDIAYSTGFIPQMLNLSNFPTRQDWRAEELEIDEGNTIFRLWLLDFSNITIWAEEPEADMPTVHGVLFDEWGNFSGYYVGTPGYLGWGRALRSVSISTNAQEDKYAVESKGTQPAGTKPMVELPSKGIITWRDLVKDDLLSIDLALDPSGLPQGSYVHLVRLEVDGFAEEVFVTTLLNQY